MQIFPPMVKVVILLLLVLSFKTFPVAISSQDLANLTLLAMFVSLLIVSH